LEWRRENPYAASDNATEASAEEAMIELTDQQRHELTAAEPVAIDPLTRQRYVLVPAEVYERLRNVLGNDTVYTTAEMLDRVMAEDDVGDPYLAELQKKYGGVP
jgi:hypothetical protein